MAQQRRVVYAKVLGSHQLNTKSIEARYLYVGMILLADDDGRLNADPRYLKGQVFSYDENISAETVQELLEDLNDTEAIQLYTVKNTTYAQHTKWTEYQKIRKDMYTPSKIPSIKAVEAEPLQTRNETVTKPLPKLSQVKLSKGKLSKEKPAKVLAVDVVRNKYSEYENVLLSDEEHAKLVERWGADLVADIIEQLGGYMKSKGKRYKDHYATINNWARKKKGEASSGHKSVTVIG